MSVSQTSTDGVPAHALRRGTRGFAAVVLFLTGMIVFAVTAFVLPSIALPGTLLTAVVLLGIGFGIAHLVAIYGVLRRRPWAASVTLYLLAIGLGLVAFASLMLLRAGVDLLAPAGAESTAQARIQVFGLFVWLAGSWLVAARFVVRGMAPPERRAARETVIDPSRVMVAHPLVIAADATRRRPEFLPNSA
jgi:4-amino-4-deoxy-L-arabinose transferase-like glycosyltransferase